jgi:error-prone DNA polymerase
VIEGDRVDGWSGLAQTASALLIRGQVQNATDAVTVVADRMGRMT